MPYFTSITLAVGDKEGREQLTGHLDAHHVEYLLKGEYISLSIYLWGEITPSLFARTFAQENGIAFRQVQGEERDNIDWRHTEVKNRRNSDFK